MAEWDMNCPVQNPPADPSFDCDSCGRGFDQKWRLQVHELTVSGSRWCR